MAHGHKLDIFKTLRAREELYAASGLCIILWKFRCIRYPKKRQKNKDHANPEGNGPQHSKERGRRGCKGPPQPEQRRQKHHRQGRTRGAPLLSNKEAIVE